MMIAQAKPHTFQSVVHVCRRMPHKAPLSSFAMFHCVSIQSNSLLLVVCVRACYDDLCVSRWHARLCGALCLSISAVACKHIVRLRLRWLRRPNLRLRISLWSIAPRRCPFGHSKPIQWIASSRLRHVFYQSQTKSTPGTAAEQFYNNILATTRQKTLPSCHRSRVCCAKKPLHPCQDQTGTILLSVLRRALQHHRHLHR